MATYTLGKDYTVSGLAGVSELTYTRTGERLDVTTRQGAKPYKKTVAGFGDETLECSVYEPTGLFAGFKIGEEKTVTINGAAITAVIMSANRSEPQDGVVVYQLTLRPGEAMESGQQAPI
jgi:predicted secreted protein